MPDNAFSNYKIVFCFFTELLQLGWVVFLRSAPCLGCTLPGGCPSAVGSVCQGQRGFLGDFSKAWLMWSATHMAWVLALCSLKQLW